MAGAAPSELTYIEETLALLKAASERHDGVIVSYSGGKDSLAVMDMCLRTFKRVEAFIMEFVPGLSMTDKAIEYSIKRFGVTPRRYIHWSAVNALRQGVYCNAHWTRDIKPMTLTDVYHRARADAKLDLIATGAKRADSRWRIRVIHSSKSTGEVLMPVVGWQKIHVLSYLKLRKIPLPDGEGTKSSGVGLAVPPILWLHDNYPEDWKRLLDVFPYAEAVVWRRKFFPELEHGYGGGKNASDGRQTADDAREDA